MTSQDAPVSAIRAYLSAERHQLANLRPIAMIALDAIISFGWAVLLLWLMWSSLNLAI
jgi:hypothetical protein